MIASPTITILFAVLGSCMTATRASAVLADGVEVRRVGGAGLGVVATRAFRAGEVLYRLDRSSLFRSVYPNLEAFEAAISSGDEAAARDLLAHSVPGESGRVYCFSTDALPCYENHSDKPNISGMHWSWLDSDEPSLDKVALRGIAPGDEIVVDYNGCSGYDVREDSAMCRFLTLCDEFGVSKRPSNWTS
jgi:hypothetical protein